MSAPPAVRPARAEDAGAVVALAAMLNPQEEHATPQCLSPERLVADFLGPDPAGLLLVAEATGAVIGYATGLMTYESNFAQRGLYIGGICVHPAHRRRGVGRALMAAVAAAGRARGARHLWWTARVGNGAAHAFYRRLGGRSEAVVAFACAHGDFERLAAEARAG